VGARLRPSGRSPSVARPFWKVKGAGARLLTISLTSKNSLSHRASPGMTIQRMVGSPWIYTVRGTATGLCPPPGGPPNPQQTMHEKPPPPPPPPPPPHPPPPPPPGAGVQSSPLWKVGLMKPSSLV